LFRVSRTPASTTETDARTCGIEIYFGSENVQVNGLNILTGAIVANGGFVFSHADFQKIIAGIDALGRS
jgi:hypothetical protein